MPDEDAMIDPNEYPAIAELFGLIDGPHYNTRDAHLEITDLIADLARAKSDERPRLDAERIERLVGELSEAWEIVAALKEEKEKLRCKLIDLGYICNGNHAVPACKDPECWCRPPDPIGHTWPNPEAVAATDECVRCGMTLADFSRTYQECDPDASEEELRLAKKCICRKVGTKVVKYDPVCEIHGNPGVACSMCDEPTRAEDGGKSVWVRDAGVAGSYVWLCADCAAGF